jgi:hypothetical protein
MNLKRLKSRRPVTGRRLEAFLEDCDGDAPYTPVATAKSVETIDIEGLAGRCGKHRVRNSLERKGLQMAIVLIIANESAKLLICKRLSCIHGCKKKTRQGVAAVRIVSQYCLIRILADCQ